MATTLQGQLANATGAVDYQRVALQEVVAGHAIARWANLSITRQGRVLQLSVLGQPLQLQAPGDDNAAYVMASATLQQLVADQLDALLPTSLIMDEIHRQATAHIPPITHPDWVADQTMGTPTRLVQESGILDQAIRNVADATLVSDGWKTWALAKGLEAGRILEGSEQAFNHGLYDPSATSVTLGGEHAIQVLGGAHGRLEIDYSQVILLVRLDCTLDGAPARLDAILRDPTTAFLASDEGALTVTRQPGRYDDTAFDAPDPRPVLRLGSQGQAVRDWQTVIGVAVDGIFGPATEVATKSWQAAKGLDADGVVGPHTWAAASSAS